MINMSLKQELMNRNQHLKETLIDEFLEERYLSCFPLFIIEECANYQLVQEIIINLSDTKLDILSKIINDAINNNHDWISIASNYIRTTTNPNYINLFNDIEGKELSNEDIKKLLFFTRNNNNFFKLNTFEDLKSIDGEDLNNTFDPNIILLNKYGISYDHAYSYFKRFGLDLDKLPECPEKTFLKDIKNILEGKNTDIKVFNDYNFINHLDSNLRNMFVKIYNEKLYKISEEKKIGNYEVNGTSIELYDAGVDFTLSIYSLGMGLDKDIPENYFSDWNRSVVKNPNFCNSIVTEKSIKTMVRHCVYGFDNFVLNDIKLLSPNDLGTNGPINATPDITYVGREDLLIANVEFRVPDEIVNSTRISNNEIYRSRSRVIDGKLEKINPSYIVYFKLTSDVDVTQDSIWQKSVQAAIDFSQGGVPLPIVIVDCEKCLMNNIDNIENLLNEYEKTYDDPEMIIQIVEYIQTIRFGYKNNSELLDKYLPLEKVLSYFDRLLNHINRLSDIVPTIALHSIDNFIKVFDIEYDRLIASAYWIRKNNNGKLIEKDQNIYSILNNTREEILKKQGERKSNKAQYL